MYQKYQTEALVLGGAESGESDMSVALFTRDFGLVWARARAMREERSKMRYSVQYLSRSHVSLINGKRAWRLAGASSIKLAKGDARGIAALARIAELTLRLVGQEQKNEYLYAALAEAHEALTSGKAEAFGMIEIVCVARLLYSLGYISNEALQTALFTHTAYTGESLMEAETMKDKLLSSINKAIQETHL